MRTRGAAIAGLGLDAQAAVAFLVAGAWITAATLLAERLGPRAGGLVGNLPSNVLVSLLFVALAQGPAFAAQAALAVPMGMAIDALFLLVVVLALPRGLPLALALGLAAWLALALLAQAAGASGPALGLAAFALATVGSFAVLDRVARVRVVAGERRRYGPRALLGRAVLAGGVVGGTVLLSGLAGPFAVGLAAVFPAVLLSTMAILARQQGVAFARATGKVLLVGSTNIVVYAAVVHLAYPALGLAAGTALAYAAAVAWVAALRPVVRRVA